MFTGVMLLEQFDLLRNQSPQKRLAATIKILKHLNLAEAEHVPVKDLDTLKRHYGEDVHYTYTRLTRGLASNREAARLGFSACLSEVLRALPLIDLSFVLASIERATTPVGNVKGQETRDYQFGRLFGLQAVVTSGLLSRKETSKEQVRELVGLLFELSLSKGWLRESCASVIIQVMETLHAAATPKEGSKPHKTLAKLSRKTADMVHELLHSSNMAKTMEGLAIHLKCSNLGSKQVLGDGWKGEYLLATENLPAISSIMLEQNAREENEADEDETKATGTWKPKLHFAWAELIRAIVFAHEHGHKGVIPMSRFWRQLVDEAMFAQNASHERKFHGLQLLPTAMKLVPPNQIGYLFSPNLMRTLINQISQEDRYLHKAAKSTAQQVVSICEAQPGKALLVLQELMDFKKGSLMFDRRSKTKTCEQIMLTVPSDDFAALIAFLVQLCQKPLGADTQIKEVDRARLYLADVLIALLKSSKTVKDDAWVVPILHLFVTAGLFQSTSSKKQKYQFEPGLSTVVQDAFKARISIALGHLLPTKTNSDTELFAVRIIHEIMAFESNSHYSLRLAPDEMILGMLKTAQNHLGLITKAHKHAKTPSERAEGLAFSLLYSLSILHIYLGEPDGVELLEDLEAAYALLRNDTSTSDLESEAPAMQILMDLLLALLSKESALLRKLVETVFSAFAGQLQRADLQLLLNVLEAQETGEGLFDHDQGEEEDGGEDTNDEDEHEIEQDFSSDDDDSSDNDEIDEGDEQTEADKQLDAALVAALGPAAQKRKADEMEDDSDSSEEELMDDDQMLKMDAHLENIFKRRKSATNAQAAKRQDAKQSKQSTIQLKSKVMDLLDIFVRENGNSPMVLYCILPVLNAAKSTSDTALADKARNLVKQKLTKQKALPTLETEQVAEAWTILQEVHRLAGVSPTPPFASMASQCSIFLAKILLHASADQVKETLGRLIEQYASSQANWMAKKRTAYGAAFFTDFVNWCAQYRQK